MYFKAPKRYGLITCNAVPVHSWLSSIESVCVLLCGDKEAAELLNLALRKFVGCHAINSRVFPLLYIHSGLIQAACSHNLTDYALRFSAARCQRHPPQIPYRLFFSEVHQPREWWTWEQVNTIKSRSVAFCVMPRPRHIDWRGESRAVQDGRANGCNGQGWLSWFIWSSARTLLNTHARRSEFQNRIAACR